MPAHTSLSPHDQAEASATLALESLLTEVNLLANRLRQGVVVSDHFFGSAANKVLQILQQRGPMSVPSIARERNTTRQNIQVLVNRLAKAGMVELSSNPAHKRSSLLHLTAAAVTLCQDAKDKDTEMLKRLPAGLTVNEMNASTALLRSIRLSLQHASKSKGVERWTQSAQPGSHGPQEPLSVGVPEPVEEEIPVSML